MKKTFIVINTIRQSSTTYYETDINNALLLQSKSMFPRLGSRDIQLVQLVECLVRLNYENVDKELCECGILSTIVDMMFYYHHNSILHLSVQKLLVSIIQSGDYKR